MLYKQNLSDSQSGYRAISKKAFNEIEFKEGVSKIYEQNNAFYVVQISKIIPASSKTLDEARGQVISDYQVQVEEDWVNSLKTKYQIEVNQDVLSKVRSQIDK